MTLEEFISHLKHKSIDIKIRFETTVIYRGNVGMYQYWLSRGTYGKKYIESVTFDEIGIMIINLFV